MLNDGNAGNEGKFEKFGISMLDMPKFLICGIEKPSKLSRPAKGDCKASLGLRSDESLLEQSEDGDDDEDEDEEVGEDEKS